MLWKQYVFRRGAAVSELWEDQFASRPVRLLYVAGRGFDFRQQAVIRAFVDTCQEIKADIQQAELVLVGFEGYELSEDLHHLTAQNASFVEQRFNTIGSTKSLNIGFSAAGEDDITASNALRLAANGIVASLANKTDVVLDVSSMPRIVYLTIMTAILRALIPDTSALKALGANGVNFQILVAEDADLDSQIISEDPSNDVVWIPGFASAQLESVQDWPLVWFPILGERRIHQFQKIMDAEVPGNAEICPILPHPSRDLTRADRLLVDYRAVLFDTRQTPTSHIVSNILYAHEAHPFEAYRQILGAMKRYRESLNILGGCQLLVTPLGSKLITLGAGLSCFEMRPATMNENYVVAIPYAHPKRYVASQADLRSTRPELCSLLLTGEAYMS